MDKNEIKEEIKESFEELNESQEKKKEMRKKMKEVIQNGMSNIHIRDMHIDLKYLVLELNGTQLSADEIETFNELGMFGIWIDNKGTLQVELDILGKRE